MRTERAFKMKLKAFFFILKGISFAKYLITPENASLRLLKKKTFPLVFVESARNVSLFLICFKEEVCEFSVHDIKGFVKSSFVPSK